METLWFVLVAFMISAYVVLDGFDLGAGIIHLFAARTDDERRLILRAIGPVWDGNEVWLMAAGGTLYFAFPALYAASFSGFYLPLMIVLWLLMLRGLGIELRSHIDAQMWRGFFDVIFSFSSLLLAVFFGAALGNVVRGVPLNSEGFFFEPLWTTFTVTENPGILDWYTVLTGLIALTTLTSHGALYVSLKIEGELALRSERIASTSWWLLLLLTIIGLVATLSVRPEMMQNYKSSFAGLFFPAAVVAGLAGMLLFRIRRRTLSAFLSSCLYIIGMLGGVAFGMYPNLLPSTTDSTLTLTVHNSSASSYGLKVGVVWWTIGITIAFIYFAYLYRSFRGKIDLKGEGY